MRPGSIYAKQLFQSSLNEESQRKWKSFLDRYEEAIELVATQKKSSFLVDLDRELRIELPGIVNQRSPPHLELEELSKIMKWKLTKGKFRPLQKLVDSNNPKSVVDISKESFSLLKHPKEHWKEALQSISQLKGIGVATGSAVLSFLEPKYCPFMADEVIESVTNGGRDYTMKVYCLIQKALVDKAEELGDQWTAEEVGRALWSCAILEANESNKLEVVEEEKLSNKRRKLK